MKNSVKSTLSGVGLLETPEIKEFRGFTLAEVLITLVIIGVIAAMTIPTLMNNTNKQEYVSRLKKTYSVLSQVSNKILAEEGTPNVSKGGWAVDNNAVLNMYKKHLSKAKECGIGENCFDTINHKGLLNNNTNNFINGTGWGQMALADGTLVQTHLYNSNCVSGQNADGDGLGHVCLYLHVDVNGQKGPNTWGIDAFRFYLTENGLYPTGCNYNNTNCANPAIGVMSGLACTCTAIRDSAINY